MNVGRSLGIDYGSERIGLALSDPLGIIATPYETLPNTAAVLDQLKEIVTREIISTLVVGMPLNLKGEIGAKAKEVEVFVEQLASVQGVSIVLWDERYTTTMAKRSMIDLGTKKKTRQQDRGRVDAMAAAILLQSYLDRLTSPDVQRNDE
jgi:putative Holliday junction resolvase